jgi:AcrR family transcriptional regulator
MPSDQSIRQRILERCRCRFFSSGFTKVTMDEMAHELGVSKKTIYKYFPSKTELLRELLRTKMDEAQSGIQRIAGQSRLSFVQKLKEAYTFAGQQVSELGQPFLRDLERNAPEIWKEFDEHRNQTVLRALRNLMEDGVRKRAFKSDINPQLLLLMYTTLIQRIMNPETLSQLPLTPSAAMAAIREVFFEGALTDKARVQYHASQTRIRP